MNSISSFDVFDTCLTRTFAYPADLFEAVGEISFANKWITHTPREFMVRRITAESAARRLSASGEITIADIYRQLSLSWNLDSQIVAKIQETELEVEELSIRPIIETRDRISQARQQGRQILFLSDMYLTASFLEEILRKHGFYQNGDVLHVSGEVGLGKRNGDLFEHARDLLKADFADWNHLGDNLQSDVEAPRQLGLKADHFENGLLNQYELVICPKIRMRHIVKSRFMAFTRLNRLMKSSRWDGFDREPWQSRLAAAMRLARLSKPGGMSDQEKMLWDIGADIAGPLLYGYVKWTKRTNAIECLNSEGSSKNPNSLDYIKSLRPESSFESSLAASIIEASMVPDKLEALQSGARVFSQVYASLDRDDYAQEVYLNALLSILRLFRENPPSAEIEALIRPAKS